MKKQPVARVDPAIQIAILDVLERYYPDFTSIEEELYGARDQFWDRIEQRTLSANLAYLEELNQVKVSWDFSGHIRVPRAAKITHKGIDRLSKHNDQ
jgi:hypothetical protein